MTALRKSPREVARVVRIAAAVQWYGKGLVSQGKAAELADLSRPEFLDKLARRKVPVIQMTVGESEGADGVPFNSAGRPSF